MKRGSFLAGFPFLAALLAVLASCGSDDCPDCPECVPPVTGSIFGYVRVTPVNDFLPGVTVRAEPGGVTAQSDSAGLYRLNGLAGGTYMVHFAKAGYAPDSAAVPLTAGASQLARRMSTSWLASPPRAARTASPCVRGSRTWPAMPACRCST